MPRHGKKPTMDISMEPVLQDYNISTSLSEENSGIHLHSGPSDSSLLERIADFDCDLPDVTLNNTDNINISSGPYPADSTIVDLEKQKMPVFKKPFTTRTRRKIEPNLFDSDIKDSETDTPEAKVHCAFQRKRKPHVDVISFDINSSNENSDSSISVPSNIMISRKTRNKMYVVNNSSDKDLNSSVNDSSFKKPVLSKCKTKYKNVNPVTFDDVFNDTQNGTQTDTSYSQKVPFKSLRARKTNVDSNLFDSILNSPDSFQQSLNTKQEKNNSDSLNFPEHPQKVPFKSVKARQTNVDSNLFESILNSSDSLQHSLNTTQEKNNSESLNFPEHPQKVLFKSVKARQTNVDSNLFESILNSSDSLRQSLNTTQEKNNSESLNFPEHPQKEPFKSVKARQTNVDSNLFDSILNSSDSLQKSLNTTQEENNSTNPTFSKNNLKSPNHSNISKISSYVLLENQQECLNINSNASIDKTNNDNKSTVEVKQTSDDLNTSDKGQIFNKVNDIARNTDISISNNTTGDENISLQYEKESVTLNDMDPLILESETETNISEKEINNSYPKFNENAGITNNRYSERNSCLLHLSKSSLNTQCKGEISKPLYRRSMKQVSFDLRNEKITDISNICTNSFYQEQQSTSQMTNLEFSCDTLVMEKSSEEVNSESAFIDIHPSKNSSNSINSRNSQSSKINNNTAENKTTNLTSKSINIDAEENYEEDLTKYAEPHGGNIETIREDEDENGEEEAEEEEEMEEEEEDIEEEEEEMEEENYEEDLTKYAEPHGGNIETIREDEDENGEEEAEEEEEMEEEEEQATNEKNYEFEESENNGTIKANSETVPQYELSESQEGGSIQKENAMINSNLVEKHPQHVLTNKPTKATAHNVFKVPHPPVPVPKKKLEKILAEINISELKMKRRKPVTPMLSREQIQQNEIDEVLKKRKVKKPDLTKRPSNKLYIPKKWVAPGIYKVILEKFKPRYGIRSNIHAEKLVLYLVECVGDVLKTDGEYFSIVEEIKSKLVSLGIIKTHWDFYMLATTYFTGDFNDKVFKSSSRNPYEPDNLFENIQ